MNHTGFYVLVFKVNSQTQNSIFNTRDFLDFFLNFFWEGGVFKKNILIYFSMIEIGF